MTPTERVLDRLEAVRRTGPGTWLARCPAHDDRRPSLSIREAHDGWVLVHCFSGCGGADVVAQLGLDLADLFPPRHPDRYLTSPARKDDDRLPRIPAADALALLDREALVVELVAHRIAYGEEPALLLNALEVAAGRIAAIRRSWMGAPR